MKIKTDMKTQIEIYGHNYEIELKARDLRNLNASKKATQEVTKWFIARLCEAKQNYESNCFTYHEITNAINEIFKAK